MKKIIKTILILLIIGLGIYITPKFLNFMEEQEDLLYILPSTNEQIFKIELAEVSFENIEITQNIPIPNEIKAKMIEEQKQKEEAERLEQLRIAEEQRKLEEQKEAEEALKVAQTTTVTSRSSTETRDTTGYMAFTATGYCPCSQCCGKSTGITASGAKAQAGVTVAMSSSYAFGTQVEIQGMGTYTVQDRGGAIQGNKIDIFFNTHQEALNFGRRTVYLKVL